MMLSGWKRIGIVLLGLWWLLWIGAYLMARSARDRAIAVDEAVTGEKWTAATYNPLVLEHEAAMTYAVLASAAPLVIGLLFYAVRWVAAGFRN